jgi:hypothetical protein
MANPASILSTAWTQLAPGRDQSTAFPRGFWPDLAVVAVYLALDIPLPDDFRPTRCVRGNIPEPMQTAAKTSAGKISAAQRAANTAALLAGLQKSTPADNNP